MSMMRSYEPWSLLNQFSDELNKMFDRNLPIRNENTDANVTASDWVPAVDVKEEADRFIIHADIPGVDPKEIDIHMEDGVLTISGERQSQASEERKGYKRVERVYGSFLRRFTLPDSADAEKITAKSSHGVLVVTIPKHDRILPRKVVVEA